MRENLVDAAELAKRLGMGRSTVYVLARRGLIPCYPAGLLLTGKRFDVDEVKRALRNLADQKSHDTCVS